MNVDELTKSLADYSPKVNELATLINKSSINIAFIIVGIIFFIELEALGKLLKDDGGGLTRDHWLEMTFKYFIALLLVFYSADILDAMFNFSIAIIKTISSNLPTSEYKTTVNTDGVNGWIEKAFISLVGSIVKTIGGISIKLVLFMRAFQMYVLKAIAPIIVAFWMADGTREMAKNLLKEFGAAAIQGVILFIVYGLYTSYVNDDIFKIDTGAAGWDAAFASILKGIIFIMAIWGSQRLSKKLVATS